MSTLKVFAALLHYPDEALQRASGELVDALDADGLLAGDRRVAVVGFIDRLRENDLFALQADYVDTFDRGRARSLYVYEHLHGESRERGQSMVELKRLYRAHGFAIDGPELPDYLPLFLEFLSTRPFEEAVGWLEQIGEVLQLLHARLAARASPYAAVLEPLARLSGRRTNEAEVSARVSEERADDTPAALDRVWMEAPVTFGPDGGCGGDAEVKPVRWMPRPRSAGEGGDRQGGSRE
jgi:nitrate reductase molybdenum cofactor assembly chaperone NarJ/NarW